MVHCDKCGVSIPFRINGMCFECNELDDFNYQCPDCNGKFNSPTFDSNEGTIIKGMMNYKCPFCGRKMEGMND